MKTTFPEKAKKFFTSWEFVLLLILFAEIVIFATKNPKFLMPRVLFGSLNDIISICIISLFVTFVMITGGIDIQAGSIVWFILYCSGCGMAGWGHEHLGGCSFGCCCCRCMRRSFRLFCSILRRAADGGDAGRQLPVYRCGASGIQPVCD